jgi:hypothetical protein
MAILFEEWVGCSENWKSSTFLVRMRERTKESQRGARRWLTQADIAAKYSAGRTLEEAKRIAQEIVDGKETDHHMRTHHIRPHPDAPTNTSMRLFLIWDESLETTEKDSIVESLFQCKGEDDQERGRKRKKDSKGKSKKRSARTSSSSGSSDSNGDSDSSSSSSHAKKKARRTRSLARRQRKVRLLLRRQRAALTLEVKMLIPNHQVQAPRKSRTRNKSSYLRRRGRLVKRSSPRKRNGWSRKRRRNSKGLCKSAEML